MTIRNTRTTGARKTRQTITDEAVEARQTTGTTTAPTTGTGTPTPTPTSTETVEEVSLR